MYFSQIWVALLFDHNIEVLETGMLPQKWRGNKIAPIYQEAGCDIDYEWQVPMVEWWLKKFGTNLMNSKHKGC